MSGYDLTTPQGRHAAAVENHAAALALYDLVFPPWRWLRWWREHRRIKQRHAELLAAHEAAS